jgi:hypothetical protein
MKHKLIFAFILMALSASALLLAPFESYDFVEKHSGNIFIAVCATNPPTVLHEGIDLVNTYSIQIISSIKGINPMGPATLKSLRWLNIGDSYLVFGDLRSGAYQAFEDYRVVPLGRDLFAGMLTNSIAGKTPDEQLQILFKHALDNTDRQIKAEQDERQRLEEACEK